MGFGAFPSNLTEGGVDDKSRSVSGVAGHKGLASAGNKKTARRDNAEAMVLADASTKHKGGAVFFQGRRRNDKGTEYVGTVFCGEKGLLLLSGLATARRTALVLKKERGRTESLGGEGRRNCRTRGKSPAFLMSIYEEAPR